MDNGIELTLVYGILLCTVNMNFYNYSIYVFTMRRIYHEIIMEYDMLLVIITRRVEYH